EEPSPDTSVPREELARVGDVLTTTPPDFQLHPKLKPIVAKRRAMAEGKEPMDWGYAELLAFGSLLIDGYRVRLSGQDSGRGTFSHRHAILFDYVTGRGYVPLNVLRNSNVAPPPPAALEKNPLDAAEGGGATQNTEVDFAVYD